MITWSIKLIIENQFLDHPFAIVLFHHVHFRPISASLCITEQIIFLDLVLAFLLLVSLKLVVVTVIPISV